MQPYQQASDEHTRQTVRPIEAGASVAGLGVKGVIGSRVLSMLNKYVPTSLAVKGLNKIDPRLGKFMSLGQEAGHSTEDLTQFISEKVKESPSNEPPKQDRNIIEKYSPELHRFLMEHIQSGRSPIEAGALAQLDKKRFNSVISKLTKDHNTPWSSIIESVYGQQGGQQAQGQPQNPQQPRPGQGSQSGPGQQALMDVLSKINQKLGS